MLNVETDPLAALSDALLGLVLPGSDGQRYPLRERIGEGGQGWVFRATWNGSVDVVVKVLRPDAVNAESLARFRREADVLRLLSQQASANPHIVRFFDHAQATVEVPATGKAWELPFTVLEYVDGLTLEQALEQSRPSQFGLDRARRVLRHVVLALRDVHSHNVIHRDLKPSNILLTSPGGREIAKVTDFGLAKLLDPGLQRTTALAGATVGYAPPEQFENGNLRVGRHTDVFSLAAIFYELVSGRPAFPFQTNDHPLMVIVRILHEARPAFARVARDLPRELAERPDVVAALDAELSRALSPKPEERHETVDELHEALERALGALSAAPSLPLSGAPRAVIVRKSSPPMKPWRPPSPIAQDGAFEATLPAFVVPATTPVPDRPREEAPPNFVDALSGEFATARGATTSIPTATLTWRVISPPVVADGMRAIAVAAGGEVAVGAGPYGIARWQGQGWFNVDTPSSLDPRLFAAAAWAGDTAFVAGASPVVLGIGADGGLRMWQVDAPGVTFHGMCADPAGVVLVGERAVPGGEVGVIAEISLGDRSAVRVQAVDVIGCGALRGVARLPPGLLACGDAGTLVFTQPGSPRRVSQVCEPPLHAVVALGDGTAITVGGGAFVFHVWPTLEARLEAMQTTRDVFALALGPDGSAWCGGAGQRVLHRSVGGWLRAGALPGPGRVRAIDVGPSRVRAFVDDGGVLEAVS